MVAPQVSSIIGSGTLPYTRAILTSAQRGNQPLGEGVRTGLQVMVGNPEDLVAVDAFATSGVSVNTNAVLIFSKDLARTVLPRCREIRIQNTTDSSVLAIGTSAQKIDQGEGWLLHNSTAGNPSYRDVTLPVLDSVNIYAKAISGGPISVRMLLF